MSPRVTGWRYAMMARVSITAREYFGGFSGLSRSRYSRISGRLCSRHPVASATSSTPRPSHSRVNSSSSERKVSGPTASANRTRMSRKGNGWLAQIRAVSRTRFASWLFMGFVHIFGRIWTGGSSAATRAQHVGRSVLLMRAWLAGHGRRVSRLEQLAIGRRFSRRSGAPQVHNSLHDGFVADRRPGAPQGAAARVGVEKDCR